MACCCTFTNTVDQQFTSKKAGQELERYRRKGAGPTTRLLIAGIAQTGFGDGTLLDVGAGVGALTFELLDRGFRRAVIVEASAAYTAAASNEAIRRGRATGHRLRQWRFPRSRGNRADGQCCDARSCGVLLPAL
jgi:16S rRNA G966 N2-methylase RsmD